MFPQGFFTYTFTECDTILEEENDPVDYFSQMPDEVILKVFRWLQPPILGNCAEVCRKFSRLVKDESLWENLDVLGKCLSPLATAEILSRKPSYLRMAKATIEYPLGHSPNFISSNLVYLDMSMAFVQPRTTAKIISTSRKLVKCSFENLEISTEVLEALHWSNGSLVTLNFALCTILDSSALSAVLRTCPRLRDLNLGCIRQNWTETDLLGVIRSIPSSVEQLNLSGFRNLMTDTHVGFLMESIPHVTDLDLSDSLLLTDASVYILTENLKYIQHLALSRCYQIKPSTYGILAYTPSLRQLEIFSLFRENILFQLRAALPLIAINEGPFSSVARPTIANQRNTIWGHRVKFYS